MEIRRVVTDISHRVGAEVCDVLTKICESCKNRKYTKFPRCDEDCLLNRIYKTIEEW